MEVRKEDRVFALCDEEEEYALLMTEFLRSNKDLPWKIRTYTDISELFAEESEESLAMLVVAESSYSEELKRLKPERMVILNESGLLRQEDIPNVDKYQAAESVLKCLLEVYMEIAGNDLRGLAGGSKTKFIGVFSPIRRCYQTTFSVTMAGMLAANHKTLYINFEHFMGHGELEAQDKECDLADLMYFLPADDERFAVRYRATVRKMGEFDYIPPMRSGENLLSVQGSQWTTLLRRIDQMGMYEYVILDLSDCIQGLFEILRVCRKIYTITREDRASKTKLMNYTHILQLYEYEDVIENTKQCALPQIHIFPDTLEQYSRSAMADFVRAYVIRELEGA